MHFCVSLCFTTKVKLHHSYSYVSMQALLYCTGISLSLKRSITTPLGLPKLSPKLRYARPGKHYSENLFKAMSGILVDLRPLISGV